MTTIPKNGMGEFMIPTRVGMAWHGMGRKGGFFFLLLFIFLEGLGRGRWGALLHINHKYHFSCNIKLTD